jgi:hypothetical protein
MQPFHPLGFVGLDVFMLAQQLLQGCCTEPLRPGSLVQAFASNKYHRLVKRLLHNVRSHTSSKLNSFDSVVAWL